MNHEDRFFFSKELKNNFKDIFMCCLPTLVTGVCQSFEWICEIGSHKQRCISCPSTWCQSAHLGEWLWNYTLSAALQKCLLKWSGFNLGFDQQRNHPMVYVQKLSPSPKAPFPFTVLGDGGDVEADPWGLFPIATWTTWLPPQPWAEMGLPRAQSRGDKNLYC